MPIEKIITEIDYINKDLKGKIKLIISVPIEPSRIEYVIEKILLLKR